MFEASDHQPLTAEAHILTQVSKHARYVVEKVALGQFYRTVLRFYSVCIIILICHFRLHVGLTRRTEGRNFGTFLPPENRGSSEGKKYLKG